MVRQSALRGHDQGCRNGDRADVLGLCLWEVGCVGRDAARCLFSPGDGLAEVVEVLQAGATTLGVDVHDEVGDAVADREASVGAAKVGLDPAGATSSSVRLVSW
jgi:hypothetical protein